MFLILQTGLPVASQRRHGDFAHWIRVAAGLPREEVAVVDVERGEALPARETLATNGVLGLLITGSPAMVTERLDWSERSAVWLKDVVAAGMPTLGICYGHQLLAHALGGEAGDNPRGREMGTVEVRLCPVAEEDPLFHGLPKAFPAQATHLQTVLRPPQAATVLADSALDDCQAMRIGDACWGLQFHPEFSAERMRGYVAARRDALRAEGRDADALWRTITATPVARGVLRRFIRFANQRGPVQ